VDESGEDAPSADCKSEVETFELPDPDGETAPALGERPIDAVTRLAVDDRLGDLLADWDPDVVHCQHLKHLSANVPTVCRSRGVPCVVTLHDFWTICHREQLYRPKGEPCSGPESVEKCAECYRRAAVEDRGDAGGGGRATDGGVTEDGPRNSAVDAVARRDAELRDALSAADQLVAPSAFLRETFEAFSTPPDAIETCRNGIRAERFEDTGFDPETPLKVGYAGRITERKGVHLLADAAGHVEGLDLHVFGAFDPESDAYHDRLVELVKSDEGRGDDRRVADTFHGWYADRTTPYREVDVLVLPSVWYENSPLVIQEAFASGVPVVTADVGGMAELVTDGEDGLTFAVGDADALADRLRRLAENPGLVADLREGVTEPKRLRDHAREVADLYAECVEER